VSDNELISVMMPCYNSVRTLGRALASLRAQQYHNWEALVVDDGSSDHPENVVNRLHDPRIRYFRIEHNSGRARARQTALEKARGEYLTMLDADDWILPGKLQRQIETAIYMAKANGELSGIVRYNDPADSVSIFPPLESPQSLPVAHAPILARMAAVRERHYDLSLKVSEDFDFFLPVVLENPYAVLAAPLYVYFYEDNGSLGTSRAQLSANRRIFAKFRRTRPAAAWWRIVSAYFEEWIYVLLFALNRYEWFLARKFSPVSETEKAEYQRSQPDAGSVSGSLAMDLTGA
jgi:glycosyltransferase involved in cell wall biosynthesis